MNIADDLVSAFNDGYAKGKADAEFYLLHCGDETPITNADKLRAMSDEELAELWWERVDCGECPLHSVCRIAGQDCKKLALDWLRSEVNNNPAENDYENRSD